jgi:hypothetical protein
MIGDGVTKIGQCSSLDVSQTVRQTATPAQGWWGATFSSSSSQEDHGLMSA